MTNDVMIQLLLFNINSINNDVIQWSQCVMWLVMIMSNISNEILIIVMQYDY